ncbi:hypothetical protein N7499_003054 [Penicillium canescens]|nr:hypothetical protein N7499_003054 [Penicillium canescens]KAJ6174484.1 hypothetical protein N7485_005221 [Penicillium canescens]KAJ6181755.1 hypothetical protein N7485_000397 [Penicillium canescens]
MGRRRPRQLDSLSRSLAHMAPQDQQILLRMVGGPHGSSSALHKDVLRVRHHRVAASQQLRHADQVHPDAWREGLVALPPRRELHRTNPFGSTGSPAMSSISR